LAAKKRLIGIPLIWRSTEQGELAKVNPQDMAQARIHFKTFSDKRDKPELIGENREEEDEGKILQVTTSSNVAEFCRSQMTGLFKNMGISVTEDGADASITADVVQFQVMERNTYIGSVRLKVELLDKSDKVLWSGFAVGTNSRWGRSYKAENYYETLSDSLVNATVNLLSDSEFRRAVKGAR
jgi:hypothetical protein